VTSLSDLSNLLNLIDDDLAPEEFEPEAIVGEIRDKIDAIKWKLDAWQAHADSIQTDWIDPLTKRKKALEGKIERLKDYCTHVMTRDKVTSFPGNAFRIDLRHRQSVECKVAAGSTDALTYPEYVKTKITYDWDKIKLLEKLRQGESLDFASLKTKNYVTFPVAKGKAK
jgi:hypothetical protein